MVNLVGIARFVLQSNSRTSGFHRSSGYSRVIMHNFFENNQCRHFCRKLEAKFCSKKICDRVKNIFPRFKSRSILLILAKELKQIPVILKYNSVNIVKHCLAQFEYVVAHRIRRGQQIISLYSRLWDEMALKQLVSRIRRQFVRRGKEFLLGTATIAAFNWENERIPDEEFVRHVDEFAICNKLISQDQEQKDKGEKKICPIDGCPKCPACGVASDNYCWEKFISVGDITVWKMEEINHAGSGLFCYKMFGRYSDVTANDYLSVFLDTVHRIEWDSHVVSLYVIDSEPSTNSDVIYWETKWPKMFSNRDYVFKRRYKIDNENKLMTIVNQSTTHPNIPVYSNKTRVNEYWSHMVIRPLTEFDQPGIEFSLTYFDNPGATLPTAISLWVSATGMPEYLRKLRVAALQLEQDRLTVSVIKEEMKTEEPPPKPPAFIPPPTTAQTSPSAADSLTSLTNYVHWARSFLF